MERKIMRERNGRFCRVDIRLEDGRLSITGNEGKIVSRAKAKQLALDHWRSYFDDNKSEIMSMNEHFGKRFTSSTGAARFVLSTDGEFHGLNIFCTDGDKIYLLESCGQIRESIAEWFPEVVPLLPWHLNDMKAGCEHQEVLGWGHGKVVALTSDTLTEAQRETLNMNDRFACEKKREKEFKERLALLKSDPGYRRRWLAQVFKRHPTTDEFAALTREDVLNPLKYLKNEQIDLLHAEVEKAVTPDIFEAKIYKDSLCAPCPTCGYEYGTKWLKRELPPEIAKLARKVAT